MTACDLWLKLGSLLWPRTYGSGLSTQTEIVRVLESDFTLHDTKIGALNGPSALFAAAWADVAYPKIITTHRYAAALMCTKIDPSIAVDIRPPWKAFAIAVPNGLLVSGDREYDTIAVLLAPDDECNGIIALPGVPGTARAKVVMVVAGGGGHLCMNVIGSTIENGLFNEPAEFLTYDRKVPSAAEGKRRILLCARRLVVGMLVALQAREFAEESRQQRQASVRRKGAPAHRIIFVRPASVAIDCRPAIREYLEGAGTPGESPIFQTMVRGHYKRQVCGVGRVDRRVIWIEPYWRGPEEAEILVRPHRVKGDGR